MEDKDFLLFIKKVKDYTSIDLSQYKEAQMKRRLTTLRMKKGYTTFASFFEAMTKDKELFYEFLDRMTINVSEFWRNPNRWEVLEQKFLPDMLRKSRKVKCWSAACSTGEEPYTLAMILAELNAQDSVVLATDIDDGALEKAKKAIYSDRSVRDVPAKYLQKYYRQENLTYHIADSLKKSIRFQKQNLLVDTFDTGFDLIVCRNVMIYFTEEAKHLLYHKFANALKPGGILFVGSTEQIFSPAQYGLESAETFFYRKTEV
ncbi:CheR family methyltransferase [Paenibacillus elgii]|uniref:protein-glutamate O-methyltransferase n=1 Tax=Paenibacillus elgii TaxID=189691 RepID=A0A163X377_9BACL|nr:protein-glutamate O-methyltransferase CheR [Paenibacillus elgii]KZE77240.1 chemotaxis protein CheR [Paenibacillus elgii]MCM3269217.1 protein-glutamate O-methyltransferase CheR [Paenibacillus elgii]NEN82081.1 protein-glutamate O-methyltransferase CheR [Paenibacillus elgii]PUA38544.1 protein-glutamate O-methyltransferase CheR [Paenibacillus elgii]